MNKNVVAVLTGDIVGSQKIAPSSYDNMLYTLESTFSMLSSSIKVDFDLFRGDSFQAVFSNPSHSMKSAIILRLALKTAQPGCNVRQSIGIGCVNSLRFDIKSSTGEAFVLSGNGLDNIKSNLISVHSNNQNFLDKLSLLTKFVDNHLASLTVIQSEALLCYLTSENKSHDAIASALNKTRSNITRILNNSRYQLIADYINHFEQSVEQEFLHG